MEDQKKHVEELIKKAGVATDSNDALKFSQAASNAASAMLALKSALSG